MVSLHLALNWQPIAIIHLSDSVVNVYVERHRHRHHRHPVAPVGVFKRDQFGKVLACRVERARNAKVVSAVLT